MRIRFTLILMALSSLYAFGQTTKFSNPKHAKMLENRPDFQIGQRLTDGSGSNGSGNQVNALFDLQFAFNANARARSQALAAVVHFNKQFWLARWSADTIIRLDSNANFIEKFTIPDVTGVRAFTWDGSRLYAAQNTNTIAIINPVTKTRIGTINTTAVPGGVRYITYVASADGGNGGFYVGNFNTNWILINRQGQVLSSISSTQHQQTGVYGIAYDTISNGGPYIWSFSQQAPEHKLTRVRVATGTPTVSRNVMIDLSPINPNGIAGGLFISPNVNDSTATIGGILQGTPAVLFGYELGNYVLPQFEYGITRLYPTDEYVVRPQFMNPIIGFDVRVTNQGATTFDTIYVNTKLSNELGDTVAQGEDFAVNLFYGDTITLSSGFDFIPPGVGEYNAITRARLWNNNQDQTPGNNVAVSQYIVSDSIYSRSFLTPNGALGIGQGGGLLANKYQFTTNTNITSITGVFTAPTAGDSVVFQVMNVLANGNPGLLVQRRSNRYIFTDQDAANGVILTLPLRGGPFTVNASNRMIVAREFNNSLTLGTNTANWRRQTSYVSIGAATSWQTLEAVNFRRTFLLWPNVSTVTGNESAKTTVELFQVYPNPANKQVQIASLKKGTFTLSDLNGRVHLTKQVEPLSDQEIDISALPRGLYIYQMRTDGVSKTGKLIVE
jgi:hypothetical protein